VTILNYTRAEAFGSTVFPLQHKALWYRRHLAQQDLQALQNAKLLGSRLLFNQEGSLAGELKTNGKQI
jgi:hypothetical protein